MTGNELLCKLNNSYEMYMHCNKADKLDRETYSFILADIPKEVDITKKQAAIIIHEYLKRVLKEEDEKDTKKALELKDLYDCRICVKHIEQVYLKGIMDPIIDVASAVKDDLPILFGGNEILNDEDAYRAIDRVFNLNHRLI